MKRPTSFYDFYHFSWAIVLMFAFALSAYGESAPLPILTMGFALSLWALIPAYRVKIQILRPTIHRIVLGSILLSLTSVFVYLNSRDSPSLITGILWASMGCFVFRREKSYGHWIGLLTIALISIIGVILEQDIFSYGIFILFLTALVFNLNAINLFSLAGPTGSMRYALPNRYFMQFIPALLVGAVVGGIIFFVFPRAPALGSGWGFGERSKETGYSGEVSLSKSSDLLDSNEITMVIESPSKRWLKTRGIHSYYRGNTLETFDGVRWKTDTKDFRPVGRESDLRYSLGASSKTTLLRIFREPHSTKAILYPGVLLSIDYPNQVLGLLQVNRAGNLRRRDDVPRRYAYTVGISYTEGNLASVPLTVALEAIRSESKSGEELTQFPNLETHLDIPEEIRTAKYFQDFLGSLGGSQGSETVEDAMENVSALFRREFVGRLKYEFRKKTELEGFFAQKEGHCEYFATAASLYLRSLGIPTRIVLGYFGGGYNEVSEVVEVRENNAHAWVEAYVGKGRWVTFDPTPISMTISGSDLYSRMAVYANALRFWFNRYVVNYNSVTQKKLMMTVAGMGSTKRIQWGEVPYLLMGFGAFLILILGFGFWYWRRQRPQGRRRYPEYYEVLLKWAEKGKCPRAPYQTHRDFISQQKKIPDPLKKKLVNQLESSLYGQSQSNEVESRNLSLEVRSALSSGK